MYQRNLLWQFQVYSSLVLKPEPETGQVTEIILIVSTRYRIRVARHHVVNFHGPNGKVPRNLEIKSTAYCHGKRMLFSARARVKRSTY
jgi:hypothetical protein